MERPPRLPVESPVPRRVESADLRREEGASFLRFFLAALTSAAAPAAAARMPVTSMTLAPVRMRAAAGRPVL